MKAILFKSENRFEAFKKTIEKYNIECTILDFDESEWIDFDYSSIDILIYFPSFEFSSNHPHTLIRVKDNLSHLYKIYPHLIMFPDPHILDYYNDKYRQFLFLQRNNYPIPETIPLASRQMVKAAVNRLGFPMVIKNRYGAGGDTVFMVKSESELNEFFQLSRQDYFGFHSVKYFFNMVTKRSFYYNLIKAKKMKYPFFSPPLLAQKFINMEKDLKTVVGDNKVIEGHWRLKANSDMWKVNIDDGGIGEWSFIQQEAIDLSEKLSIDLNTRWLNIDIVLSGETFLITEFSPIWHHYKYKEKESFVYKDDYNISTPLQESLDLEDIIVNSLKAAASKRIK